MFKRYLGISLIAASLVVVGCSSSDDEDDAGGNTTPEVEMPVEGEGEAPVEGEGEAPVEGEGEAPVEGEGEAPVEGEGEAPVEGEGETPVEGGGAEVSGGGNVIGINNSVNATGAATASVWIVHGSQGSPAFEVVNNDQIEEPLITDATDPGGQLNFDTRKSAFISLDPVSNSLDFIADYYSLGNRDSSATVDMQIEAGSSSLIIARGSIGDTETPFELIGLTAEPADPDLAKIRLVHAARGFNIINAGTCNNCTTNALDIYLQTSDLPANPMGEPVGLSYADQTTGYLSVAPAEYNVIVTEAGNADNVRVAATTLNLVAGTVMTVVAVDGASFGSSVEYIPLNDLAVE